MIRLECSNCKTVLNIDDAFAGGVCRCQYCGTIQTVPKKGASPSTDVEDDASAPSQKTLFKRKARIESALSPYNDQLDKAADEMESSGGLSPNMLAGLNTSSQRAASSADAASGNGSARRTATSTADSRTGLPSSSGASPSRTSTISKNANGVAKPSRAAAAVPEVSQHQGKSKALPLIGSAAAIIVIGTGAWFAFGGHRNGVKPAIPVTPDAVPAPVVVPTPAPAPTIAAISLQGPSIVYVLDRNGCTQDVFKQILDLCFRSLETLSPARSFQIIVWNNYQELAFPATGPASATAANIAECRKALADTNAASSDISGIIGKAAAGNPQELVIISASEMEPQTVQDIRAALAGKSLIVHGIAVGTDVKGDELKNLATSMRGQFQRVVSAGLQ